MNKLIEAEFINAVHSRQPVAGLTHGFYRYPARFSPLFARAAIKTFSQPGDAILDPFMGGGTTLVEARILGRQAIGTDINSLAVFIAKVKTDVFSDAELSRVSSWAEDVASSLNLHKIPERTNSWPGPNYLRNFSDQATWPIRKTLELSLDRVGELSEQQQNLARCILLKTAQWALDCRTEIPNAQQLRKQFLIHAREMTAGAKDYAEAVRSADRLYKLRGKLNTLCLERSAVGLELEQKLKGSPAPKLILTSPPYPGVHVLYHRWQIQGRRETAAPFWITNTLDGSGASFYTFGDRKQKELKTYYEQALAAFTSLARVADKKTLVVQMVAFSDPPWQLQRYLEVMEQAGFKEVRRSSLANSRDGRLWRCVPNRKWYANQERAKATSKEVVLFHQLAR